MLEAVVATIKRIQEEIQIESLLDMVIFIHLVVDSLMPKLRLFHMLGAIWPECSSTLLDQGSKNQEYLITGSVLVSN